MHPPSSHDLSTLPTSLYSRRVRQSQSVFQASFDAGPRPTRSTSTTSTSSFRSCISKPTSSINEVLSRSFSSRSGSFNASRRPSCFCLEDVEEEKAEFGEEFIGLLEPRPGMGWWGVREVLEGDNGSSRRGSMS